MIKLYYLLKKGGSGGGLSGRALYMSRVYSPGIFFSFLYNLLENLRILDYVAHKKWQSKCEDFKLVYFKETISFNQNLYCCTSC